MGGHICRITKPPVSTLNTSDFDTTEWCSEHVNHVFPSVDEAEEVDKFEIGHHGDRYNGRCVSVYDGDTFHVAFCFRGIINSFTIRLYGIDCPEIKPRKALFDTEEDRLKHKALGFAARDRVIELIDHKKVVLEVQGQEKFGRLLAKVFLKADDGTYTVDLADLLISEGHGTAYFGGTKPV